VTPGSRGRVFVLRNGNVVPVPVQVGLVSETQATVTPLRGTLGAGDQVVTADNASVRTAHASGSAGNPLSGMQRSPGGFGRGGAIGAGR
jgi:hypothetical protein